MTTRRVHYIDWLRVLAVLLLFPFHAGRVYNYGEPFYAKSPITSVAINTLLAFITVWHMPLLFLLAGMSTYFALRHGSIGQYAGERMTRLLVPLLFGVFVIVPPQTWYGAQTNAGYTGSYVEYLSSPTFWSVENLFGKGDYYGGFTPAHLWFILFLLVISLAAIPLLAYGRGDKGAARLGRLSASLARPVTWLIVAFVLLLADALPDVGGKNPFWFFVLFALGFIVMFDDTFTAAAARHWTWALPLGIVLSAVTAVLWPWRETLADPSVLLAGVVYVHMLATWATIVGLLGAGKAYLDQPSRALAYLGESSYPVYILHQTVIVVIGFYLVKVVQLPALSWPVLIALSAPVTYGAYEVARRVAPLRFLLGMKPAAKVVTVPAIQEAEA